MNREMIVETEYRPLLSKERLGEVPEVTEPWKGPELREGYRINSERFGAQRSSRDARPHPAGDSRRFCKFLACLGVGMMVIGLVHGTEPVKSFSEDGFRLAIPGYELRFPKDHAAHKEFKTEWWYFTGHLSEKGGKESAFGYQLTFFRTAINAKSPVPQSAWGLRDICFGHFAISDFKSQKFWFTEKISRETLGIAGTREDALDVWLEKWSLRSAVEGKGAWDLKAFAGDHTLELNLYPVKKEVVHGLNGVSQKAAGLGKATHYVSLTRMKTEGKLTVRGKLYEVNGESWFDHEFGSSPLTGDQAGWDWFSVQFDSGEELMLYLLRKKDGCFEKESSGTWVDAKGVSRHLGIEEVSVIARSQWTSPATQAVYPQQWELRVPKLGINVTLSPLLKNQELVLTETGDMAYWEGACKVTGSHSGRAYVELTGYDGKLSGTPISGGNNKK